MSGGAPRGPWPPAGYVPVRAPGADGAALADAEPAVRRALAEHGTLYAFAAAQPGRRELRGRAPTYAVPLPGAGEVVVRHAWHGGLLAPALRDLFVRTRAPHELGVSERLRRAGVRTPRVVAYVRYRAGGPLRRADVATRLVPGARDLAEALGASAPAGDWVAPVAELLAALARAGAWHPDLNLKNVLLAPGAHATRAWALDVDVVRFVGGADAPSRVLARNLRRLARSLDKWRRRHALPVTDAELAALGAEAHARLMRFVDPG